jgi:hypothetical protein
MLGLGPTRTYFLDVCVNQPKKLAIVFSDRIRALGFGLDEFCDVCLVFVVVDNHDRGQAAAGADVIKFIFFFIL